MESRSGRYPSTVGDIHRCDVPDKYVSFDVSLGRIRFDQIYIQFYGASEFLFIGELNGLDSWVLSEVTSLLFVYVCDIVILLFCY